MTRPVEVIGYRPRLGRFDPEILADYQDYPIGMTRDLEQFRVDLEQGVIPPGVIVRIDRGAKFGYVAGVYGNERIEVI